MTRRMLVLAALAGVVLLALVFHLHLATRTYATNPDTTPVTGTITVTRKHHDESDETFKDPYSQSHKTFQWTEDETSSYTGINAQPDPNSEGGDWFGPANANDNLRVYQYQQTVGHFQVPPPCNFYGCKRDWTDGSETNIDGGAPSQARVEFSRHTNEDTLVTTCNLNAEFDASANVKPPAIKGTLRTWHQVTVGGPPPGSTGGGGKGGGGGGGAPGGAGPPAANSANQNTEQTQETGQGGAPMHVQLSFTCDPNATSISGEKTITDSNGKETYVYSWNLHLGLEPETEVEIIKPNGYDNWLPEAGADEKTVGNYMVVQIVAHKKGDPSVDPPKPVKTYTLTLDGTSREKGVDLNWPSSQESTLDYDLKIDSDNPVLNVKGTDAQSAETNEEDLKEFMVKVNCYDWGGYTNLKVTATLHDGSTVTGHVQGDDGLVKLAIPKDDNSDHIADAWENQYRLKGASETADDDKMPAGDGTNGDSIVLYDEYRGFHINGQHERLSPLTKDLFIYNISGLGAGVYSSATGVNVHLVAGSEVDSGGGGKNPYTVSPNGQHGNVYAIFLHAGSIGGGVVGETHPGPSTPDNIRDIIIDANLIAAAYGMWAAPELQSSIAHELGHGTNIWHHGDGPDYEVGDVTCRNDDGTVTNFLCSSHPKGKIGGAAEACFGVAAKGGMFSGNDQCIMRYDMTNFFEDPNGNCHTTSGKIVTLSLYGQDPPGMHICYGPQGTGVNDPDHKPCKAGNATRGDCAGQLRIKSGGR